jgi:hypothetical protein
MLLNPSSAYYVSFYAEFADLLTRHINLCEKQRMELPIQPENSDADVVPLAAMVPTENSVTDVVSVTEAAIQPIENSLTDAVAVTEAVLQPHENSSTNVVATTEAAIQPLENLATDAVLQPHENPSIDVVTTLQTESASTFVASETVPQIESSATSNTNQLKSSVVVVSEIVPQQSENSMTETTSIEHPEVVRHSETGYIASSSNTLSSLRYVDSTVVSESDANAEQQQQQPSPINDSYFPNGPNSTIAIIQRSSPIRNIFLGSQISNQQQLIMQRQHQQQRPPIQQLVRQLIQQSNPLPVQQQSDLLPDQQQQEQLEQQTTYGFPLTIEEENIGMHFNEQSNQLFFDPNISASSTQFAHQPTFTGCACTSCINNSNNIQQHQIPYISHPFYTSNQLYTTPMDIFTSGLTQDYLSSNNTELPKLKKRRLVQMDSTKKKVTTRDPNRKPRIRKMNNNDEISMNSLMFFITSKSLCLHVLQKYGISQDEIQTLLPRIVKLRLIQRLIKSNSSICQRLEELPHNIVTPPISSEYFQYRDWINYLDEQEKNIYDQVYGSLCEVSDTFAANTKRYFELNVIRINGTQYRITYPGELTYSLIESTSSFIDFFVDRCCDILQQKDDSCMCSANTKRSITSYDEEVLRVGPTPTIHNPFVSSGIVTSNPTIHVQTQVPSHYQQQQLQPQTYYPPHPNQYSQTLTYQHPNSFFSSL